MPDTALRRLLHPDLAALVETVRTGTVSMAATSLGLSQPALSARLGRLARSTGAPLFLREGRRLRLTAESPDAGRAAAAAVAPLVAPLLGWDDARMAEEIAAYSDRHPLVRA